MTASRRTALAGAAGLAAGVVLVLGLWLVVRPTSAAAPAPTTPASPVTSSTTTTAPVWVSAHERRLGPAVLIPISLEVEGGQLVLGYDLANVTAGSTGDGEHWSSGPDRWTLVTRGGEMTGRSFADSSRAVRFDVGAGFDVDDIMEIRIDGYRVASPVTLPLPLARDRTEPVRAGPELEFRLVQVIEQADNWLVIVEVDAGGAPTDSLTVDGIGGEWVSSSASMLGSPRWTLDYRGEALPDPLPLVVRGQLWVEIEESVPIDISGVLE